jgi:hypothetical protein
VSTISSYLTPIGEAARKFEGTLVARVFGLEQPRRYNDFFASGPVSKIPGTIAEMGDRFVFGQGFRNLADVEDPVFRDRAHTITVPLPGTIYDHSDTWKGDGHSAVFLCPAIQRHGYYRVIYEGIKREFGDLPHVIFGRQSEPITDPAILPYLTDADLIALYARTPVFVYPSAEPRHVHYSPVEAMVVGTPVLYRAKALLDFLAGEAQPGACVDTAEMRAKAKALLAGDRALAEEIRDSQHALVKVFSVELAARQWSELLLRRQNEGS